MVGILQDEADPMVSVMKASSPALLSNAPGFALLTMQQIFKELSGSSCLSCMPLSQSTFGRQV